MTPLVSVLLPVYNAADTVAAALRGILEGALADLEVLAVDDGSTDGSAERLRRLAGRDPRVRVLAGPHPGLAAALNAALQAARAPYVARMDADDTCHPERLARQVARLEAEPALDLVGCGVELCRPGGAAPGPGMARYAAWVNGLLDPDAIARARFVESPVVHATVVARRAVFEGGYRVGPFPEDYELWLRRLHAGARFANLPDRLYTWSVRAGGRTHGDPDCSAEAFRRLKLEYLLIGPLRGRPSVIVWGTGRNGKRWIQALRRRAIDVPLAVDLHPRKLGRRIHGALVVSPEALLSARAGQPILAAVGKPGGREWIADWLSRHGLVEGVDFWAVC